MPRRYRKEDHAAPKSKPKAKSSPKAKSKNKAPSATGRTRAPQNKTSVSSAMDDALKAKGTTLEQEFAPRPIEEAPEIKSAIDVNTKAYSKERYPNILSTDISHHTILTSMIDSLENRVNSIRKEDPFTGLTATRGSYAIATKQVLNVLSLARHHAENSLNAHLNGDSLSSAPHFLKATDLLHEALRHANNTIASQTVLDKESGKLLPVVTEAGITKSSQLYGGFLRTYNPGENAISLHPLSTANTLTKLANGYVDHALKSEFGDNTDAVELAKSEGNLNRAYHEDKPSPSFADVDAPGLTRGLSSKEKEELQKMRIQAQEKEAIEKAKQNSIAGRAGGLASRVELHPDFTPESPQVKASAERYVQAQKEKIEGTVLETRGKSNFYDTFTPWDREKALQDHALQIRALRNKAFDAWIQDGRDNAASREKANLPADRPDSKTFIGSTAWQDPEKFLLRMAVKSHWLKNNKDVYAHEFESTDAHANPEAYIQKNNLKYTGAGFNKVVPADEKEETKVKPSETYSPGDFDKFSTPMKEDTTSTVNQDIDEEAEFNKLKSRNNAFGEGHKGAGGA